MPRLTLALITVLGSSAAMAEGPAPGWVDKARTKADALGSQLQQALHTAITEGGPVAGIEVCRIQAPVIAQNVSDDTVQVGRTSLKTRNPDNAPDSWEDRVLEDFERRLAAGEAPGQIEAFAIRNTGERRFGHWMKAIPTQGQCTVCHGTDIPAEIAEAINNAYPNDQARGYSAGELRGAFSVQVKLENGR